MVNCQLRNDLRGVPGKWACSKAGGGGGGLTWPLILRIFGMVSITFFFCPPSYNALYYRQMHRERSVVHCIDLHVCHLTLCIKYLGNVVLEHGIKTDPEKTRCIADWSTPSNAHELRHGKILSTI